MDSFCKIVLLNVADETIKEWMREIMLRPPFRYREDWGEDVRKFELEDEEE
jgi:hypothetical protein